MSRLKTSVLAVASIITSMFCVQLADARPSTVHEDETVSLPEPYAGVSHACLRGNDLLVVSSRPDATDPYDIAWAFIHLRRQADDQWHFMSEVASGGYDPDGDYWTSDAFACEGSLAAFSGPDRFAFIFEHTSTGWRASEVSFDTPYRLYPAGVDISGDTVAFNGKWRAPVTIALVRKNASGQWTNISYVEGNPGFVNDPEDMGSPDFEFTGTQAIVATNSYFPAGAQETVTDTQVFDLINGQWQLTTLPLPQSLQDAVAIDSQVGLVADSWTQPGEVAAMYTRDAGGAWTVKHSLLSEEAFVPIDIDIEVRGERAFSVVPAGHNSSGIGVYRREAVRRYRHVATLIPTDSSLPPPQWRFPPRYTLDGNRVVVTGTPDRAAHIFTVPSILPAAQRLEETFEDNSAAEWMPWGMTDWRLVTSDGSRVYRQQNVAGDARAILQTFQSEDQSIQADVRVRSLGASSWVGFMVRYTSPQNFYYLLVNGTSIQIRRMHNGVFGPITSVPFTLALNRTYRFRVEAIGTRLRAFVNDVVAAEVVDDTHAEGTVGLTMWRSSADFDNIVVTTNPRSILLADDFSQNWPQSELPWSRSPANAWSYASSGETTFLRQSLLTGRPMAHNGGPAQDQTLTAEVRPRAFDASGNGIAGLMARYVDANNHYFAVITNRNTVSLRKRVNGVTTILDDAAMTVTVNTVYRMRFEAIGSSLRVYVNDRLMVEAQDTALPSGRYGLMTYLARADFDTFSAIRP